MEHQISDYSTSSSEDTELTHIFFFILAAFISFMGFICYMKYLVKYHPGQTDNIITIQPDIEEENNQL